MCWMLLILHDLHDPIPAELSLVPSPQSMKEPSLSLCDMEESDED